MSSLSPSRPFILRPVATSLLMVALFTLGVIAYQFLPLSALPEVDYPTIQVQTFLPGASPEVMTSTVTAPLERQFGEMPGLKEMSSRSSAGASIITLQFDLSLEIDIAEQEVQAAINASGNLLPASLPAPPIYAKVNPADAPILTLAVTSSGMPLIQVEDLAETRIAQKISQVAGVGLVSLNGAQRPAVRIQANMDELASYGLNIDDLRTTISNANQDSAKGSFDGSAQAYTIDANDQISAASEFAHLIVAYRNGDPVRLSDVATVTESAENSRLASWMNGTPAVLVNIQRQPGANVIGIVDQIKKILPEIETSMPANVDITILTDRTDTIRASVNDVEFELSLAVALVVMVIFLFLRNVRATIIPSLSVPLSLVGTFALMYLLNFSINNLSLMALTIAAGFVVDDAIVMIENISRYLEKGEKPLQAALRGSGEIGFTIMSLTAALIAVLIPLLFMKEVVGRLFREFAITLAISILISAVVSLTLVPMLCAKVLKSHEETEKHGHSAIGERVERGYRRLVRGYDHALSWVLEHQRLTLWVAVGTLVLTVTLYIVIPKGFFPLQDTGLVQAMTEAAPSISFDAMVQRQQALADALRQDPDVVSLSSFVGVDGTNSTLNDGRMLINLKPKDSRSDSILTIMARLSDRARQVPGITLYLQPVQDLTIESTVSRAAYQFVLGAAKSDTLRPWIPKLLAELQRAPELRNVSTNFLDSGLTAQIQVDRDTAARFGVTAATIDNALYDAFGQRIISTIYAQSNQYRVIMQAVPSMQSTVTSLNDIYLPAAGGGQVPLSSIAHIDVQSAPLENDHLGQFPAAMFSFDVSPSASLEQAVNAVRAAEQTISLPASISTVFEGSALAFQSTLANEVWLLLAAIATVYIVLGVLYESYIHPLTILSTLPSAGIGALLGLMIAGLELNIISIIGIILLIGIVKKNAIMMIDFALTAERDEGKSPREAIHQAALLRFRPIMMTTFAAMFAALPLMLGRGTGSELRQPLGVSIVGGLLMSQALTLFTTPVVYLYFDRLAHAVRRWRATSERARRQRIGTGLRTCRVGVIVHVSAPFIQRPVATTLLTIGVALGGGIAFSLLPVAPMPNVDIPTISVGASLPGASPDTVATSVTTPLERHLGVIAGVTEMTSQSSVGSARITLQFELSRNIDGAARDVEAAIQAARVDLPTTLRNNPTYNKFNPSDAPVMVLTLTSDTLTTGQIYDSASTIMQQKLLQLSGVGEVDVGGASLPAVRVELNPRALFRYGIGLEDVRAALSAANANSPKGSLEDPEQHYQLYVNDTARLAEDYRPLIIAYRNNNPVRLSDIADVSNGVENVRNLGLFDGKKAVLVVVHKQPGANIIDVTNRVAAVLPQLKASIPGSIDITPTHDRTGSIRASLNDVEGTLLIASLLVVLVVYLALRSVRAAMIPAVAVPLSLIGTFGAMYAFGFSLDNLSLMALTVATGFVVDDAIVMLENISRHIESGLSPFQAAMKGSREVGFTVLAMTCSLIAVFLPILLMGGLVGRTFREFAVTLSSAIILSLLVSLTATPMMCAHVLRNVHEKQGRFLTLMERGFNAMRDFYQRTLKVALDHPRSIMAVVAITVALNVYLFTEIPKGFFPQEDTGAIQGNLRADQDVSFQAMQQKLRTAVDVVRADPAVLHVSGSTGGGGGPGGGGNTANMFIDLKPLSERKLSGEQVIARLRQSLAQKLTGGQLFLQVVQDIRAGGRQSNAQYQYTILADDVEQLTTWAPRITEALRQLPELEDVNSDRQVNGLDVRLNIDRNTAAKLGINLTNIDNTLYDAFGQRQVSTIYNEMNQYHVVMEVEPSFWQNPATLREVWISTQGGALSGSQSSAAAVGAFQVGSNGASSKSASASSTSTGGGAPGGTTGMKSTTGLPSSSGGASTTGTGGGGGGGGGAAAAAAAAAASTTASSSSSSTAARNAQLNALTNSGRGAASTGASVSTSAETMVPLAAVASYGPGLTPMSINHQGPFVATTISFNLPVGEALGTATVAIQRAVDELHPPVGLHGTLAGTAQVFQKTLSNELWLIFAAICAVFIVLGILYESFMHPITIISTLPSGGVGAVLALLLFNTEFSLIALIGVILLIGIVKKNAIIMIDVAITRQREHQLSARDAIYQACLLRFRPIMMTTFAALFGAMPLALTTGNGAELRQPLGISIVGGLLLSQVLTLYTTPVVFMYLDRFRMWLRSLRARRTQTLLGPPPQQNPA